MSDPHAHGEPIFSDFAGDPDMKELIELFLQELPARIESFRSAQQAGDAAALTRLAHQLRGASAGYGFAELGTAAGTVEDRLRALSKSGDAGIDTIAKINAELGQLVDMCRRASLARN